jgi:hypothetical protein
MMIAGFEIVPQFFGLGFVKLPFFEKNIFQIFDDSVHGIPYIKKG